MGIYQKGLSIKQDTWYVKKQKRYRIISKKVIDKWDNMQKEGKEGS
jgi:hypothetical protein